MRLYSVTNMYMAGIHAGIQTQHSTGELFAKYRKDSVQNNTIFEWVIDHKTTIVLNGGMHQDLVTVLNLLEEWEKHDENEVIPFAPFYEPGVNNALTSISIVMREDAIEFMDLIRKTRPETPEFEELQEQMLIAYGRKGVPVLQALAFMPLAK
ncbi:hypothetical protein DQT32_04690 [Salmonella enterica subsp. enterica serovar Braenderup]|nr:hypothetical protein [Salmonella enterica subsp. enterica serovar Braenderup]